MINRKCLMKAIMVYMNILIGCVAPFDCTVPQYTLIEQSQYIQVLSIQLVYKNLLKPIIICMHSLYLECFQPLYMYFY